MNLVKEIASYIKINVIKLIIKYKLCKDNKSYIKIAKDPIFTLRIKYITLEYYYFYLYIDKGLILIKLIYAGE